MQVFLPKRKSFNIQKSSENLIIKKWIFFERYTAANQKLSIIVSQTIQEKSKEAEKEGINKGIFFKMKTF